MHYIPEIPLYQPITKKIFKRVSNVKLGGKPVLPQTVLGTKSLLQNIIKNCASVRFNIVVLKQGSIYCNSLPH